MEFMLFSRILFTHVYLTGVLRLEIGDFLSISLFTKLSSEIFLFCLYF